MIILFGTVDLKKLCHDERLAAKEWGVPRLKLVRRRLDQFRAASNLAALIPTPGRPHPLKGNRRGAFTIDLDGPYRLVFEPADEPLPLLAGTTQLDYSSVVTVRILGVEDTHD